MPIVAAILSLLKGIALMKAAHWSIATGIALALNEYASGLIVGYFDDMALRLNGLPADTLALMSVAGIFEGISIIVSAALTATTLVVVASRIPGMR